MANSIRIKRRTSGAAGAPAALLNAEVAFNEVDNTLWYGKGTGGLNGSATTVIPIGGDGAYVNLTGTQTVSGGKTFTGDLNISGATVSGFTTTGGVVIGGDLTVNGVTTTINSTTVSTDDKNIELGATATPTDSSADGGGITLKGATDKTIRWLLSTDSWTFGQSVELAAGKAFRIDGTEVLSKTALGSGVTGSSLTSLGTVTTGTWNASTLGSNYGGTGQTTYANGELLIGNSTGGLSKANLTAGTGVTITNSSGGITIAAQQTLSAGDGLALTGGSFSIVLEPDGGIVSEAGKLAVDLGATSITGTLGIIDGGTGATTVSSARAALGVAIGSDVQLWDADLDTLSGMQTGAATALALLTSPEVAIIDGSTSGTNVTLAPTNRMVINNAGTMAQVALSNLVAFFQDGATSGFVMDGGTY